MAERLAVLLYGQVVGRLEQAAEGDLPTFSYDDAYVSDGAVPLSLRLPISQTPYSAQRVEPYLRGLLPENSATLGRWADRLGVAPDDIFAILAEMGWECPGAVQFCRPDDVDDLLSRNGEYKPVSDADIAERLRELVAEPASWSMPGEHWSLGGQQEKFALTLLIGQWHEAHGSAATTHIIKPGIKILHHQALVEHLTMAAASELGVDVAASRIVQFGDQWALVVERFDRVIGRDGSVVRVHQEDFCQALGRLPELKYESRGGPRLTDLAGVVRRWSSDREDDLMALADFAAINLVAGAPDGHSKNISLLLAHDGQRRIAPLYDLATGLSYDRESVERSIALSIGGERTFSRVRRKQWEKAARTLGLDPGLLIGRARGLAEQYPDAFERAVANAQDIPGAYEVGARTLPALRDHCKRLIQQLASDARR
ncbi:type II toxin-antitoxin system HipA family toxin [Kribbella sp. NPDC056345]|uniref:type II toxin-antitoxin system HipA family toxin n=1 Tax=Kribbella sp. NPDC056345 TaxID=3345789 RepID=UPI0035DC881E